MLRQHQTNIHKQSYEGDPKQHENTFTQYKGTNHTTTVTLNFA